MHMAAARLGCKMERQYSLCAQSVGGITRRVLCTLQLPGLAIKWAWLAPGGPILVLTAWTGLETQL